MHPRCEVLFHLAATQESGLGHAIRCLTLADMANRCSLRPYFYCKSSLGIELIEQHGFSVLSSDADVPECVILDHPSHITPVPVAMVKRLRSGGAKRLGIFDERGEARQHVDALVDVWLPQFLQTTLPSCAQSFYGFDYAVLRKQFTEQRTLCKKIVQPPRVFLCMGGTDPHGLTGRALEILGEVDFDGALTVVLPVDFERTQKVDALLSQFSDVTLLQNVQNMAEEMSRCELVFTKLGQIQLEAFCLGCGVVLLEPTEKHLDLSNQKWEEYKSDWPVMELGLFTEPDDNAVQNLHKVLHSPELLQKFSKLAVRLVDGRGAERALSVLCGMDLQ